MTLLERIIVTGSFGIFWFSFGKIFFDICFPSDESGQQVSKKTLAIAVLILLAGPLNIILVSSRSIFVSVYANIESTWTEKVNE